MSAEDFSPNKDVFEVESKLNAGVLVVLLSENEGLVVDVAFFGSPKRFETGATSTLA